MTLAIIKKFFKLEHLILVPILALAFYMAFIPHADYSYPLHVDEWVHLAHSGAMQEAQSATHANPFSGEWMHTFGRSNLEAGFQLFWAVFQQISGISWLTIFRYFPSIILMMTALSVYIMGRRQGFGWEAALFACLIPTTVGILGPAFLVPVALGLLFIALSLFLAFNFRTFWSYIVLLIFTSFMLAMHAPTAVGLALALAPYVIINLRGNFKHSLGIALAVALPFLVLFPWIFDMLLPTAKSLLVSQPLPTWIDLPRIIRDYGYYITALCLLGTFVLALNGGKKNYGLILGLLAVLLMLVFRYSLQLGIDIMYHRGLMYMMLLMSMVAGAGLMAVKNLKLPDRLISLLKGPSIARLMAKNIGYILCLALVIVTLALAIPNRQNIGYYHIIGNEDYRAFSWIKENVDEKYEKAVLDPWKGTPFTAITGKEIYTRLHEYPKPIDYEAKQFLDDNCRDTEFLLQNGISIVYTQGECDNPDLVQQEMKSVYLLKESD